MKVSELIKKLQECIELVGDKNVYIFNAESLEYGLYEKTEIFYIVEDDSNIILCDNESYESYKEDAPENDGEPEE